MHGENLKLNIYSLKCCSRFIKQNIFIWASRFIKHEATSVCNTDGKKLHNLTFFNCETRNREFYRLAPCYAAL